jgi:hypothetical protein
MSSSTSSHQPIDDWACGFRGGGIGPSEERECSPEIDACSPLEYWPLGFWPLWFWPLGFWPLE